MVLSPIQIALAVVLAVALAFVWYVEGRGRWRALVDDRFLYGIPWGTLVTVGIVVAFYLFGQGGLRHWSDPVTFAFVSWSYFYPTGLVTSGIAHGSPAHLVSNMAGTLALAPIAEYAWGHYPGGSRDGDTAEDEVDSTGTSDRSGSGDSTDTDAPGGDWKFTEDGERATEVNGSTGGGNLPGFGGSADEHGVLGKPWIRAVVLFPAALLTVAFLTAVFSLGPGLGFSGAVYAIVGFAVITYPLSTVVAVVATSAMATLYRILAQPVVHATIDPGTPGPPSWAGIAFQSHTFGFLIGVVLGISLLVHRARRPATERVFFATLAVGMVQSLWLVAWPSGEEAYALYQGAGMVFVVLLTLLITVAVAGSDRALPRPLSVLPRAPTRRQLAIGWLLLVGVIFLFGLAGAVAGDESLILVLAFVLLITALLAAPAVPPVVPDRWIETPISRRQTATGCLVVLTVLIAVPTVLFGLIVVDDTVPGSGGIELGDYTVTYEENATAGQSFAIDLGGEEDLESQLSGVLVHSDDREISTVGIRDYVLEHEGGGTVEVGGVGWRETVHVERTGWDVLGNETVYVVDLEADGETTRSFESDPLRANARIDGHVIDVVPTADGFELQLSSDGTAIGTTPIPDSNESATVGDVTISTEPVDETVGVFVEIDDTSVQIAERETYADS